MGNNMANTVLDHNTALYSLQTLISSRVLTALGEMRTIWDSKVSHDHEFIQQEKCIIHNRWESQPAFLGSAHLPLPYQHRILPLSMKSQLVL